MPRYAYKQGQRYAARLLAIADRPIINQQPGLSLLRLEFEMFSWDPAKADLRSLGQIACRDLVIRPGAADDQRVVDYARALMGDRPQIASIDAWKQCARQGAWVTVVMGPLDDRDARNEFEKITPFSANDCRVIEFDYNLAGHWVAPGDAAKAMRVSEATVRRYTRKHLAEYGNALERRTPGGHRRINLILLRHLIQDPTWFDAIRIAGAQRVRELERENMELRRKLLNARKSTKHG
jgi:hypothetical protein